MWTVAALVLTVLMGGFIAYAGDLIGRRFGKRRVSIFGLRPKHTAIVITSCTGVLISCLTTGILFLVVPPVRQIILEGQAAIRALPTLRRSNAELTAAAERARATLAGVRGELKLASAARDRATQQQRMAQANLAATIKSLGAARAQIQQTAARLAAAQRVELKMRRQMQAEQRAAQGLAGANETWRRANRGLQEQNGLLSATNQKLVKDNATKQQQNLDYASANQELARGNEDLVRESTRLKDGNRDLLAQQSQLENAIKRLEARNYELETVALRAFGSYRTLADMFDALRTRRVIVHTGEDLARAIIPADSSSEDVRAALGRLMHDAHVEAVGRGAAAGPGKALAVQVVDKQFFQRTANGESVSYVVTDEERIAALVTTLARQPEPVCIQAMAIANTVEGEPGAIDFQPYPNRLIFRSGQAVAARDIDGRQASGLVFNELVTMLKGLGETARARGFIPKLDPLTGRPEVGELNAAELVDVVARVRSAGRKVTVTAIASADTNAADRLAVEFRLGSAR